MMTVTITTPTEKRSLQAESVTFISSDGCHTWLLGHEPMMAIIKAGSTLRLEGIDGSTVQEKVLAARGGICRVDRTSVHAVLYA